jgi:hypothetical protein
VHPPEQTTLSRGHRLICRCKSSLAYILLNAANLLCAAIRRWQYSFAGYDDPVRPAIARSGGDHRLAVSLTSKRREFKLGNWHTRMISLRLIGAFLFEECRLLWRFKNALLLDDIRTRRWSVKSNRLHICPNSKLRFIRRLSLTRPPLRLALIVLGFYSAQNLPDDRTGHICRGSSGHSHCD